MQHNTISWVTTKNHLPSLTFNGKHVHSIYNPVKEAKQFAAISNPENISVLVLMGLGMGYHISYILEQIQDQEVIIIAWEPNAEIYAMVKNSYPKQYPDDPRIMYLSGPELDTQLLEKLSHQLNPDKFKGYQVIYLPSGKRMFGTFYQELLVKFEHFMQELFSNRFTELELERLWIRNIITTVPKLAYQEPIGNVKQLIHSAEGIPACVCAAGPSLKYSLPYLQAFQEVGILIAVDTALQTLLDVEIVPDIVVSLDSQLFNYKDIFGLQENHRCILVCDITCYPKIIHYKNLPTYLFKSSCEETSSYAKLCHYIEQLFSIELGQLETGGSVACSAIDLARLLGCRDIFLFGQDLAFSYYQTHVASSPHYSRMLYTHTRLEPISSKMAALIGRRQVHWKEGIDSNPVLTERFLASLVDWFYRYSLHHKELNIINATENGIALSGISHTSNREWKSIMNERQFNHTDKQIWCDCVRIPNIINKLQDIQDGFRQLLDMFKIIDSELQHTSLDALSSEKIEQWRDTFPLLHYFTEKDYLFYCRKKNQETYKELFYTSWKRLEKWLTHLLPT